MVSPYVQRQRSTGIHPRAAAIAGGATAGFLARGAGLAFNFVALPMAASVVGPDGLHAVFVLVSIVSLASFVGLGSSKHVAVAAATSASRTELACDVHASLILSLAGSLVLIGLSWPVLAYLDVANGVVFGLLAIGLPLTAIGQVQIDLLIGLQQIWRVHLAKIAALGISLAALACVMAYAATVEYAAMAISLPLILSGPLLVFLLSHNLSLVDAFPVRRLVARWPVLVREGGPILLVQAAPVVLLNLLPLMMSLSNTPHSDVGVLLVRLLVLVWSVGACLCVPLWIGLIGWKADQRFQRSTLVSWQVLFLVSVLTGLVAVCVFLFAGAFIGSWLGLSIEPWSRWSGVFAAAVWVSLLLQLGLYTALGLANTKRTASVMLHWFIASLIVCWFAAVWMSATAVLSVYATSACLAVMALFGLKLGRTDATGDRA